MQIIIDTGLEHYECIADCRIHYGEFWFNANGPNRGNVPSLLDVYRRTEFGYYMAVEPEESYVEEKVDWKLEGF